MPSKEPKAPIDRVQRYSFILLVCTMISLLGVFGYTSLRTNLLSPVWIYFFLYLSAYAIYVYAASRVVPVASTAYSWITPFLICTGAFFRLILVHAPPSLSTDIYRYVWDGRLTVHGINPFRWSPNDPRLWSMRDHQIWLPMEYKPYQTVYMSISQAIFALGNLIFGSNLTGFKFIYTAFDIGNMLLLARLLQKLGQPSWKVVWYAWCPLPIIEIALSGHQDVTGVFFFLATFVLFSSERIRLSAITLAASVLTKGFPLLLIPLFARRAGWRYGVLAIVSLIVLGVPQLLEAHAFLHGMQQYLMNVEVNGSVHALIDYSLQSFTTKHTLRANQITDLIMVAFVAVMIIKPVPCLQELMRRSLIIVCSCLLVVPTLFPWYLVWLIPIATCVGKRPSAAVIVLVGTVVMNYTFYFSHETYWWSAWVEYVPFYAVLLWEWITGYWRPVDSLSGSGAPSETEEGPRPMPFEFDGALKPVDA
jgi:alpha-1,6-mannosyltransferase